MSVTVSGTVPTTLFENARPGDWSAVLRLSAGVLEAVLTGPDAGRFDAAWDAAACTLIVTPAMAFDAEALGPAVFRFGVSARTAAGWQAVPAAWEVALIGVDDTPPQALRFATGGSVHANDLGAAIGTLAAEDPDTAAPLEFSVAWPDSAYFEVVGATLRLRPGVDLLGVQAGVREVLIEASDGRNHAAFLLPVTVLPPRPPDIVPVDGTAGADTLPGGTAADWLLGHGGADSLAGLEGEDSLEGGAEADTLDGGAGADTALGGEGGDSLWGDLGGDQLLGGEGNDTLRGGSDGDTLAGEGGDDLLDGGSAADSLAGGAGDDRLLGAWAQDTLAGGEGADTLDGGPDHDVLNGGEGADSLSGGDGADSLRGEDGADTLGGGVGADTLAGGPGDDSYLWEGEEDLILEAEGGGLDEVVAGVSLIIPGAVERLRLRDGAGDLSATGSARADRLLGNDGRNALRGEAGEDTLDGMGGADTLLGGEGADRLAGGAEADWMEGGAGADLLFGEIGADTLLGGVGGDRLAGGEGADLLDGGAGEDTLLGGAGDDTLLGGVGDRLEGGEGADLLVAEETGAELRGGAGADTLDATAGEAGDAILLGGAGDDLYLLDAATDAVLEFAGGGADTVRATLAGGGYVLPPDVEVLVLLGATAWGAGNDAANRLLGSGGANLLRGGGGADTLDGSSGDDTLMGGAGADLFLAAAGPDRDHLRDFTPGEDRLLLSAEAGFRNGAEALAALQATFTGAALPLPGGGFVLFEGVSAAALRPGDILIG
jgi:Ca2+-binding RTX toxin-like protein